MPPSEPDAKPPRRIRDSRVYRELHASQPRCRLCGQRPISLHHLVPRSAGGDDIAENLIALCGDGARGCHGHVEFRDPGYRQRLRARLTADEIAYVIDKKGARWLDRHYPRP